MRKQDQLNALISSLTKHEKRYFRLFALPRARDKQFMRLFDELSKTNTYDAATLAEKLKLSGSKLADTKDYLQQVLLRSLCLYQQDKLIGLALHEQWKMASILCKRNMYEMAYDINERTLQKALAYENFQIVDLTLSLKYNLLIFLDRSPETSLIDKRLVLLIEQMGEIRQIMTLCHQFGSSVEGKEAGSKLKYMAIEPVFNQTPDKLKSDTARMLWHDMKQYYYNYTEPNLEISKKHILAKLRIFESHPELIYNWSGQYTGSFLYLSNHCAEMRQYDEALQYAERLEFETDGHRKDISDHIATVYNEAGRITKQYILCYMENYEEALRAGAALYKRKKELRAFALVYLLHHYTLAFFHLGKYDRALKICEEMQALNTEAMKEIQLSNKLLLVVIHHALKNYSLIPYQLNSAAAWAKRHLIQRPGTLAILRWMRKLEKINDRKTRTIYIKELKTAIENKGLGEYVRELGLPNWLKMLEQY